jgi:protein-S-isoprenylcysteine O-methyltransferase Ste14
MTGLNVKAWLGIVGLAVVTGVLLFAAAGTVRYWQGWVFLAVFLGAAILITLDLARHDPALLQRRLAGGPTAEKRASQQVVMLLASLGFIGLLVVPALGHCFDWWPVPLPMVIAGDVLVAAGLAVNPVVFRENSFAAARIEIASDHKLIATGPYAWVRHPQYAGALLYLVGMPLALGSYAGLPVLLLMAPVLVWRLLDEEHMLVRELPGYAGYQRTVRARLIPGIF